MKKGYSVIAASLIFYGCTDSIIENTVQNNQIGYEHFLVTFNEASECASKYYAIAFGDETRSSLKVHDVETFHPAASSTRTDSGSEMYGFYIINYDNQDGFAIVSADRRRDAIYAISDNGSLHLIDTLENKGLSWYLNEYLLSNDIILSSGGNFPDLGQFNGGLKPTIPCKGYKSNICEPLLTSFMSRFHQNTPYNKYCHTIYGEPAVVGCAPLAVGTVMAYNEYPDTAEGYTFNWKDMKKEQFHDNWSRLFEILGRSKYLKAIYGKTETGVDSSLIPNAFKQMGYNGVYSSPFDENKLQEAIRNKRPVICIGKADVGGHAWIIDGSYHLTVIYNPEDTEENFVYEYDFYNCIWGWNGNGNGYFRYSNGLGGTPYEREDGTTGNSPIWNNLWMIYGFTKS